jgi:predicted DNA-binding transcriptional regulator AlpA
LKKQAAERNDHAGLVLIGMDEVTAIMRMHRVSIQRLLAKGKFPSGFQLTKHGPRRWRLVDIEALSAKSGKPGRRHAEADAR